MSPSHRPQNFPLSNDSLIFSRKDTIRLATNLGIGKVNKLMNMSPQTVPIFK